MKRINACSLALLIVVLAAASCAKATTVFYVSNDGSDKNAGTQNAPFATIQKAVDAARAGDTVKVLAGTYTPSDTSPDRGMIIFRHSGTAAKPITFEAVGKVIIRGRGDVSRFRGIFEINAKLSSGPVIHDLIIRGFRLENSNWFGIHLSGAKNITLENNYTFETGGSGIRVSESQNITIRGNTLERACISPDKTIDTQEIISLASVEGFEVAYNHIFNGGIADGGNGGEGIDVKGASRDGRVHHNLVHDLIRLGIYVDSYNKSAENIIVDSNTVYNCAEGIAVSSEMGGTVKTIKLVNNIVYHNRNNGIVVSAWKANGLRKDIEIINNTVFRNGFHSGKRWAGGGGITLKTANASGVIIRNNIVSQNNLWQILVNKNVSDLVVDYNLIDAFRGYTEGSQQEEKGKYYINGNPLFVDANGGNFRLKTNSPAIDRGNSLFAPDRDFDSNSRPKDKAVDVGAFEISKFSSS
jgi:parallel beta-helix repeat protein